MTDVSAICLRLRELQSRRRAVMKGAQKLQLQQGALLRRAFGWSLSLPKDKQAKITKAAAAHLKVVLAEYKRLTAESGGMLPVVFNDYRDIVCDMQEAAKPLIARRASVEKDMVKLAASLPLTGFVDGIKGFGYFGLSVIIGEAGELGLYANPAKLWKRMGLAVFHGKSQRRTTDADDAILQGYSPTRRSAIWTLGDSLLKQKNVYKDIYDARKEYIASDRHKAVATTEVKSKMHAHRQAQRFAEKRLLRDLWKAWRVALGLPDNGGWKPEQVVGQAIAVTHPASADDSINDDAGQWSGDIQTDAAGVVATKRRRGHTPGDSLRKEAAAA